MPEGDITPYYTGLNSYQDSLNNADIALLGEFNRTNPVNVSPATLNTYNVALQQALNPLLNMYTTGTTLGGMDSLSNTLSSIVDSRPGFTQRKYDVLDVYTPLSDGTYYPTYENIVWGTNNEERLAAGQSTAQVWGRGLKRFLNTTVVSAAGNLTAIPVGIYKGISQGSLEAMLDNDYVRWLDDQQIIGNLNNNIYYSQADKDASLFGQLTTSRFWADKALGGLSFTVGILVSEGLIAMATGGASHTTSAGRLAARMGANSIMKQAAKRGIITGETLARANGWLSRAASTARPFSETLRSVGIGTDAFWNSTKIARAVDTTGQFLHTGRFLLTSTGYEASMESRMYKREAEKQFDDYYRSLGIKPTAQITKNFQENLDWASKNVFYANLGILSVSNLAMFGKVFRVGIPGLSRITDGGVARRLNKTFFGIGTKEVAPGEFKAISANLAQKMFHRTYVYGIKPSLSEGLEEGGQGTASGMMQEYIKSTYDPDIMKENLTLTDNFINALKTQFGEKEGQTEVLVGAFIGMFMGGALTGLSKVSNARKAEESRATIQTALANAPEQFLQDLYTQEDFLSKLGSLNRIASLDRKVDESLKTGKQSKSALEATSMLVSMLQASESIGKGASFVDVLKGTILGMNDTTIMSTFGFSTADEVKQFKEEKATELDNIVKDFKRGRTLADLMLGKGTESVRKDGIAYAYTMAAAAERIGYNSVEKMRNLTDLLGDSKAGDGIQLSAILQMQDDEIKSKFAETKDAIDENKAEMATVVEDLRKEQAQNATDRSAAKLKELQDKLEALTQKENFLKATFDGIVVTMNNKYFANVTDAKSGFLSSADFLDVDESLQKSKEFVEALKGSNPEIYIQMTSALNDFEGAVSFAKGFGGIYADLVSDEFDAKKANTPLKKLMDKETTLNDHTRNTLAKIIGIGTEVNKLSVPISNVTDEEYQTYLKDETTLPDTLKSKIATKIFTGAELTASEQKIYDTHSDTILEYTSQPIQDSIVSKLKKKEALNSGEERYYFLNKAKIDGIINDPLSAQGQPLNADTPLEPLSEEMESQVAETERERTDRIKGITNPIEIEAINDDVDNWYKNQVRLGRMTSLQAMDQLQKAGRGGSLAYRQLQSEVYEGREAELAMTVDTLKNVLSSVNKILKFFNIDKEVTTDKDVALTEEKLQRYRELYAKKNSKSALTPTETARIQELASKEELTEEETEEYQQLGEKSAQQGGLTGEELIEIKGLEDELMAYNLVRGTYYQGQNLLNLLQVYEQSLRELKNSDENKTEFTEEELVSLTNKGMDSVEEGTTAPTYFSIIQNMENALVKIYKDHIAFSHVFIGDLVDRVIQVHGAGSVELRMGGKVVTAEEVRAQNGVADTHVTITVGDKTIEVFVPTDKDQKRGSYLRMKSKDMVEDLYGFFKYGSASVKGQQESQYLLMGEDSEGNWDVVKGTVFIENESGLAYDKAESKGVRIGDKVTLVYDETDSYNKGLKDDHVNKGVIYILKNGKIVGILKALHTSREKNKDFYNLRKRVVSGEQVETTVTYEFGGFPILKMSDKNTTDSVPINKDSVITQGYMLNGTANIEVEPDVSMRYVRAASEQHKDKKIPFVVVQDKTSGKFVAFPVTLRTESNPVLVAEFEAIVADQTLSEAEKAILINEVITESGLPSSFLIGLDDMMDFDKLVSIEEALLGVKKKADFDVFTNDINAYEISSPIDFENEPFTTPKFAINIKPAKGKAADTINLSAVNNSKSNTEGGKVGKESIKLEERITFGSENQIVYERKKTGLYRNAVLIDEKDFSEARIARDLKELRQAEIEKAQKESTYVDTKYSNKFHNTQEGKLSLIKTSKDSIFIVQFVTPTEVRIFLNPHSTKSVSNSEVVGRVFEGVQDGVNSAKKKADTLQYAEGVVSNGVIEITSKGSMRYVNHKTKSTRADINVPQEQVDAIQAINTRFDAFERQNEKRSKAGASRLVGKEVKSVSEIKEDTILYRDGVLYRVIHLSPAKGNIILESETGDIVVTARNTFIKSGKYNLAWGKFKTTAKDATIQMGTEKISGTQYVRADKTSFLLSGGTLYELGKGNTVTGSLDVNTLKAVDLKKAINKCDS